MAKKIIESFISRILKSPAGRALSDEDTVKRVRALFESNQLDDDDAERACRDIVDRDPGMVDALWLSADIAKARGDSSTALARYAAIISQRPDDHLAYYKLGNLQTELRRLEAALESYSAAVSLNPDYANAYCNRGVVLERLGRPHDARASYDQAIALNPKDALAYHNRAGVLRTLGNLEAALADYDRSIELKSDYPEAECNRGLLLSELKRWDDALAGYDRCLERHPSFYQAHFNRGALLQHLGRLQDALATFDSAIQASPGSAEAYSNRGVVLTKLGQWQAAVASYSQAVLLNPDLVEAYGNRAEALLHLSHYESAIADYDKALSLDPTSRFLVGARLHAKTQLCSWQNFDEQLLQLRGMIDRGLNASHPFFVLGLFDSPPLQEKAAAAWVQEMCPAVESLGPFHKQPHHKLRLGYFSADFRDHAVAHLIADLFDLHDRSRFELYAFSLGPDTKDTWRKRLEHSFDQFFDVRLDSSREIAERARALEIDIAIDLTGHTAVSKTQIFAHRAAPLQVAYLGYPGTMGAPYFDYVIADRRLLPPGQERFFTENVIYLPHTYQANSMRTVATRDFTRAQLGLPPDGFVFCCFNNNFKILPATFDRWMSILRQVPSSVLWLLQSNETVVGHLREEASRRGVDPSRLVFAARMSTPDHLARHRAADLFIDTLPYNAHTTASDALWAGLPLITCSGESFAARVATSLLRAVDLPELIAATPEDFEVLAVGLATNPERLSRIREKLASNSVVEPLFDTRSFAKHLEAAYVEIHNRYLAGLPPSALHIPP